MLTKTSPGFTLMGSGHDHAEALEGQRHGAGRRTAVGRRSEGQDAAPRRPLGDAGPRRLATTTIRFNGNVWRFAKGHRVKVELLGRDAPTYRPSNGSFSVRVLSATVSLPTREAGKR